MLKQTWEYLTRLRYSGFRRLSYPIRLGLVGIPFLLMTVAILFPVYEASRPKSRMASCMSNEKQISLGILQYVQDYDETFPVGIRGNLLQTSVIKDTPQQAKFHAGQGWAGQLYPYLKNYQILQCPEEDRKAVDGLYPVSYAYNRNMALKLQLANVSHSEMTVLLAETLGNRANVVNADEHNVENVYSAAGNGLTMLAATDGVTEPEVSAGARYATGIMGGYGITDGCALQPLAAPQEENGRHNGGANFAMADGHVKFCKPGLVSPGDNAADAKQAQDCVHGRGRNRKPGYVQRAVQRYVQRDVQHEIRRAGLNLHLLKAHPRP